MALISAEELAWALDISIPLAELAIARVRARQLHEKPPPLLATWTVNAERRVGWHSEQELRQRLVKVLADERRVWWADE